LSKKILILHKTVIPAPTAVAGVHFPALPAAAPGHSPAAPVVAAGIWVVIALLIPAHFVAVMVKTIARVAVAVVTLIAVAVVVVGGSEAWRQN
jgi:hypothetical protein